MWQYTNFKDRKCTMCGKTFKPNSGSQRVCSKECSLTRQRRYDREKNGTKKLQDVICTVCGKNFKQHAAGQKSCSVECRMEMNRIRARAKSKVMHEFRAETGVRRDIKWNLDFDPWDTFKSGCYGFVRDADLCPMG